MSSSEGGEREEKNCLHEGKPDETFSAASRIQKREDFKLIYAKGKKIVSESFTLFALGQGIGRGRLGITITRRIGTASVRNRIKRLLREIFRKNKAKIKDLDIVINVKPGIREKTHRGIEGEFLEAVSHASGERKHV